MAKTKGTAPPTAEAHPLAREIPMPPAFRRAKAEDAIELARATFLHGRRLDMGTMASELSVARGTLYRWCGSRETLHERILEQRAREFCAWAVAEAEGEGRERLLEVLRLILDATVSAQPVRRFMEREPALALRILTARGGALHKTVTEALSRVASEADPGHDIDALRGRIDVAVHVGSTLQWATVAIEQEPSSGYIVEILRRQLID